MWFGLSGLSYDVASFWALIIQQQIHTVNWSLSISKGNGEDPDPKESNEWKEKKSFFTQVVSLSVVIYILYSEIIRSFSRDFSF